MEKKKTIKEFINMEKQEFFLDKENEFDESNSDITNEEESCNENLSCMELWAKDEIERICKKSNPDFDIFSDDFDYDGSCYKSAFKAYRSICNDGHSGMSYGFTKNILIKLLNEQPLTPIIDEDFFVETDRHHPLESKDYLKERGLKSSLQCPRRSSLFREETLDGKVSYKDIDRRYCFNVENPSDTYSGFGCKFVDEMFPITMPYHPSSKKYAVATREFLVDKSHGDFDTIEILYIETPEGKTVDVNRYFTDGRNVGLETDDWTEISKEKYDELCKKRLDKVEDKITDRLLWTLVSNSRSDEERKLLEKNYKELPDSKKDEITEKLRMLIVKHIVEPCNFKYNTFNVRQALCTQDDYYQHELSKIEGLKEISEYLNKIYNLLKNSNMQENFIDLGLPSKTLWADKNVGASSPEEHGKYFTFEEAQELGIVPSKEQFKELIDECEWNWEGKGYEVIGPNGNSIYLPAAGGSNGTNMYYVGTCGFYVSSTPFDSVYFNCVYVLDFGENSQNIYSVNLCCFHSVRLVKTVKD